MADGLPSASETVVSLLARKGLLDTAQLERARRAQPGTAHTLEHVLTQLGLITERQLAEAYAELLSLSIVERGAFPAEPILAEKISAKFLKRTRTLPIENSNTGLAVAMADPS